MNGFFDELPVPEPSSLLGFSSNEIWSNVEARTPGCLSAALDSDTTRFLAVKDDRILMRQTDNLPKVFFTEDELTEFDPDIVNAIMPGTIGDDAIVAVPILLPDEDIKEPYETLNARSVLYSTNLSQEHASAIGMALSLLHWHKTNQFCGICGARSRSQLGGVRRDCRQCKSQIFPRTDPVVIMLAIRGAKCLLGRNHSFPPNWYSCLAGFVEPGETFEQAVRRETLEESGIEIGRVKYFASQPWPFPHSLMIGAFCEALNENITFDGSELEDCRWFDVEEVKAMVERRHQEDLKSPPNKSIASGIIRYWLEQMGQPPELNRK